MKECLFYRKLENKKVQCETCHHYCTILPGNRGICGVRENKDGKLCLLVYNKAVSCNIDPIEKKPLFHFMPGSYSFSVATVGCNFHCQNCQNADISQASKEGCFFDKSEIPGEKLTPKEIIEQAKKNNCQSISYTYTEPTIFFKYALDIMRLAQKEGLKNCFVSNGYMTEKVLKKVKPYLDAINVDLKFFNNTSYLKICGAKLKPILENLKLIKKLGIWLEITTLLIPKYNDSVKELTALANFIAKELGINTPWHISRFYPAYKLIDVEPTPVEKIHEACNIGKKAGLKYVYAGNIPDDNFENTYCPKCGKIMIKRIEYEIERFDKNGKCSKCNNNLDLILK